MEENLKDEVKASALCDIHEHLEKNGMSHFAQLDATDPVYVKRLFVPAEHLYSVLQHCHTKNYFLSIDPTFFALFGESSNKRVYEITAF